MEHFTVSARKYRPQTFQEVVGQQHITSTLRNAIKQNHLAHAFLFVAHGVWGKLLVPGFWQKPSIVRI